MSEAEAVVPSWFVAAGTLVLAVAGVAILGEVGWRWSGRKRQWAAQPGRALLVVTIFPAIGAVLILLSIAVTVGSPVAAPLAFAALGVMWAGILLHMSQPDWWGPRWYRDVRRAIHHAARRPLTRFERPFSNDAGDVPGQDETSAATATPAPADAPVVSWHASWVRELELGEAGHGVRIFDEVAGFLELRPSELGFVSDWIQDMIRRVPTALAFGPDDIKGIRVVPPGADLYGTVVKGARRSSTPGLVLETEEGPFLFGVHALDEVAEAVAEFAGLPLSVEERPAASPSIVAPWQRVPPDPETVARMLDTRWVLGGPGSGPGGGPGEGEVVRRSEFKLAEYRHPLARFSLPLPEDWLRAEDCNGIALLAAETHEVPWVRANAVVTIERLAPGTTLASWLDGALVRLAEGLDEILLIDVEETSAGDRPARRVLAHHTTGSQAAVTMEQWLVVEGHLGYTVTVSVAPLEYEDFAPSSERIGRGLRPDPEFLP